LSQNCGLICFDPWWPDLILGLAWLDFSGGHEMKDKSSGDACRNGNDCPPQPIRKNAKAKYRQASPQSDFDKDRRHRVITLSCQF
jgi:hypothetical protein